MKSGLRKNPDKVRIRHNRYRLRAIEVLGNKCHSCGEDDIMVLQIDHVNGDGYKERNRRKSIFRKIALRLTDIDRYQVLCANCNWRKRILQDIHLQKVVPQV